MGGHAQVLRPRGAVRGGNRPGGGSPLRGDQRGGLQTIIKQRGSAGTADPLDQRSTVGWKATKAAEILVEPYLMRVECTSAFSPNAEKN